MTFHGWMIGFPVRTLHLAQQPRMQASASTCPLAVISSFLSYVHGGSMADVPSLLGTSVIKCLERLVKGTSDIREERRTLFSRSHR